jgi:hypothetical protein
LSAQAVQRRVADDPDFPFKRVDRERLRELVQAAWRELSPDASGPDVESFLETNDYPLLERYRFKTRNDESRFRFYRKWRPKRKVKRVPKSPRRKVRRGAPRSGVTMVELVRGNETMTVPMNIWFDSEFDQDQAIDLWRMTQPPRKGYDPIDPRITDFIVGAAAIRFVPPRVPAAAYTVEIRVRERDGSTTIEAFDVVRHDLRPKRSVKGSE